MILDMHCFSSKSLWLWHKEFPGDNIVGNECAITAHGDIIMGSNAFKCEITTNFCRKTFDLIRGWVTFNCPELLTIGDNITNEHQTVMHSLNTYPITQGWMLEVPAHTEIVRYVKPEHIRWYFKAPHLENMYSEVIFLPDFDVAELYNPKGLEAAYKGMLLLYQLTLQAGYQTVPYQMTFDRTLKTVKEILAAYRQVQERFIPKDHPAPAKPPRSLCLEDDIHLTSVFTSHYLRRMQ